MKSILFCIGYHGTEKKYVENIIKNKYILSSDKEWFGAGVYFFETLPGICNGRTEARNWVLYVKRKWDYAIFKADISSENYVDLLKNISHKKKFDDIVEKLYYKHIEQGKSEKEFNLNIVFKYLEKENKIDFIRCLVNAADKDKYKMYRYIVRRPQIQICVKNVDIIRNNKVVETSKAKR